MPQNGVMEIPNDDESDKSDKFSLGSLWKQSWHEYKCSYEQLKSKSSTGTGTNVATAHATSGGSRLSQPLRAGRLHCGDVGGTKMPPKDVIVISSDDESSDSETYDNESYDDASDDDESSDDGSSNDGSSDDGSSDDESSDEQQKSGPGCPLAQDRHLLLITPHATTPLQRRLLLPLLDTRPHALITDVDAIPSSSRSYAE
ncbi:hypothetical protein C8A01DRAFT_39447 [Parachaetomium inaequale]|uniref:Uncharacterized protein n=1 Tax=Parachaetomium inaequale TaxID=2588326 RepID=A0AAN6PDM8_9PEZI|nr:hypothetical protein C8A01DRAFT_39447 [Parachaetomium inaequale]